MKFITEDNRDVNYYDRKESWLKYKEKTKNRPRNHKVREETTYREIVTTILQIIRDKWVTTTGGVYMKNLGYFAVYRTPHKSVSHNNHFSYVDRLNTDGYMYIPTHFTSLRNSDDFFGFNFNDSFPQRMTGELYKNIKDGRRYTLNYSLMKEYLKNRTNL